MANPKYATSPPNLTGMPPGVPYIIGNEGAERFSFYGMRTILIGFMTQFLVNKSGVLTGMPENEAQGWFHQFVSSVYWMPFFGAIMLDGWLGKYRTILYLSIVYCLGHVTLAMMDTSFGIAFGQKWVLAIGLILIAMGAGGIKPCVSANVGDQFGESNKHLLERVFGWFYFSINLGLVLFHLAVPGSPPQSELGSEVCLRIARRSDVHRDRHLLDGSQQDGPRAAGRPGIPP